MSRHTRGLAALGALTMLLVAPAGEAAPRGAAKVGSRAPALFALVIGSNRSVDRELEPLAYADDDAVRFFELFELLGARVELLTRADANTRRLHVRATKRASAPTRAGLERALRTLRAAIARARARGRRAVLYFIFGGHGNVKRGRGYITLEDSRLDGRVLSKALAALGASQTHVIVDACHSFFLAHARGPGGSRRSLQRGLATRLFPVGSFGLLLSTSAENQSHEWGAIQAGVFSHEIRSGLYGAADANGDGQITYRELGAFVKRANASIPNDRFRPSMFAVPPRGQSVLLDLRHAKHVRRISVGRKGHGRFSLEDERGVRMVDFHSDRTQSVRILAPRKGVLYLRNQRSNREYTIPAGADATLASLVPRTPRSRTRGAAGHAFKRLFALPFGAAVVHGYQRRDAQTLLSSGALRVPPDPSSDGGRPRWRTYVSIGLFVGAAGALAAGVAMTLDARSIRQDLDQSSLPQLEIAAQNERISTRNRLSVLFYALGGVALAGGLTAILWPSTHRRSSDASPDEPFFMPTLRVGTTGAMGGVGGRF